jgi:hypothetical protein
MPFVLVNAERDARALEVKSVRGYFLGVDSGCRSEFVRIAMITQLLKWRESPWTHRYQMAWFDGRDGRREIL